MPNNLARATAIYGKHIHLHVINWNIPLEVVEILLGYVFENRLPRIPSPYPFHLSPYANADWPTDPPAYRLQGFDLRPVNNRYARYSNELNSTQWHDTSFDIDTSLLINISGSKFITAFRPCSSLGQNNVSVGELKQTLKDLIKSNKLKIPISKLKKKELIHLLFHTEFACSETIEAYTKTLCPGLRGD